MDSGTPYVVSVSRLNSRTWRSSSCNALAVVAVAISLLVAAVAWVGQRGHSTSKETLTTRALAVFGIAALVAGSWNAILDASAMRGGDLGFRSASFIESPVVLATGSFDTFGVDDLCKIPTGFLPAAIGIVLAIGVDRSEKRLPPGGVSGLCRDAFHPLGCGSFGLAFAPI